MMSDRQRCCTTVSLYIPSLGGASLLPADAYTTAAAAVIVIPLIMPHKRGASAADETNNTCK